CELERVAAPVRVGRYRGRIQSMTQPVIPEVVERMPTREPGDKADAGKRDEHHDRFERERRHDEGEAEPGWKAKPEPQLTTLGVGEAVALSREVLTRPATPSFFHQLRHRSEGTPSGAMLLGQSSYRWNSVLE